MDTRFIRILSTWLILKVLFLIDYRGALKHKIRVMLYI